MRKNTTILLLATAGLTFGCDREDPIKTYTAPKEHQPAAAPAGATAAKSADVVWTLPTSWKEVAGAKGRIATIQVSEDPGLVLTVNRFEGKVGGLLANINRWETEIGATPSEATDLDKVVKHTDVGPLHLDVVDLMGAPAQGERPQLRTLAAMLEQPDRIWFFKLSGPADKVEKQKANFDAFIASLKSTGPVADPHAGHDHDHGHDHDAKPNQAAATAPAKVAEPTGPAGSAGAVSWKLPAEWKHDPTPRMMREATFTTGPADAPAEITIVTLPLQSFAADPDGNINRWRNQVGLPPSKNALADSPRQAAQVGDMEGVELVFANPEKKLSMRLIMVQRNSNLYYFKILGPEKTVQEQKDAFASFLSSIRIAR